MDDACRQILQDLSVYLDGECPDDVDALLEQHLVDCPPCFDRADFERELRALVAEKCRCSAPPGLVDRVMGRLEAG